MRSSPMDDVAANATPHVGGSGTSTGGRLRKQLADWGAARTARWYVMRALARVAGFHVHYLSVDAGFRELRYQTPPRTPPGYETRLVDVADLLPYVDRTPGLSAEFVQRAVELGYECIANFHHGDIVGYSFSSRTRAPVTDQLDVIVPTGFRYGFKGWTHPDHRRLKLSEVRTYVRFTFGNNPPGERSIHYIETHNYPSLLHRYRHPRERRIRIGYVGWITLFGRQIPFNSRGAKWLGAVFLRRDDTRVRLYAS